MKIPENIVYITNHTTKATISWENGEEIFKPEEVLPAFIADASNPKTIATGKAWAESKQYWAQNQEKKEANIDIVPNTPLTGIKLITLEHRGNGGRAYKIILPGGYYVDLREDVLVELARSVGIAENGILNGEYIWASVPGGMKLIRIDSSIHKKHLKELAELKTFQEKSVGKKEDLEVGGVYTLDKVTNKYYVFLGLVNTYKIKTNSQSTTKTKLNKQCLWCEVTHYGQSQKNTSLLAIENHLNNGVAISTPSTYTDLSINDLRKRLNKQITKICLRENIIEYIQSENIKTFHADWEKNIAHYQKTKHRNADIWQRYSYDKQYFEESQKSLIREHLPYICMVPYPGIAEIPEWFMKKILEML